MGTFEISDTVPWYLESVIAMIDWPEAQIQHFNEIELEIMFNDVLYMYCHYNTCISCSPILCINFNCVELVTIGINC